jgi:membrane protein YdbS with pleckstrin-like domain
MPPFTPDATAADRPHRPTDDAEEVYFDGSPRLRAELSSVVAWGLAGVALLAIVVANLVHFHVRVPAWLYGGVVLLSAGFLCVPSLLRRTLRYRITNYRIDVTSGLLGRNTDTLELWHVEDLRLHQSPLDRITGVGTINVFGHDPTTPKMSLRGLPAPAQIFRNLEQRIIAVKRQSGVMKVDAGQ